MTNVQKLSILKSQLRSTLISNDAMSAEDRAAKTAELLDTESRYQTAVAIEATEQAKLEPVENRMEDLVSRISLKRYMDHAISETPISGAEKELNSELKAADNVIPWAAFVPHDLEERATTDISGKVRRTSASPLARLMAPAASSFANIETVTVPAGERQFVAWDAGATAGDYARNAAVTAAAATFTTVERKPSRGSLAYEWNLESTHLMPSLEQSIRADAANTLRLHLSRQALFGSGTSPAPQGLVTSLDAPTAPTDVVGASDVYKDAVSLVDGIVADSAQSVRVLLGPKAFQVIAVEKNSGNFLLPKVRAEMGEIRVSGQFPAPAGTIEHGLAIATSAPASVYIALWAPGPVAILDKYTKSDQAINRLSLHYFYATAIVRDSQYKRLAYKVA